MSLKWTDTLDIAIALDEAHPDVDPLSINFVDLAKWCQALEGGAVEAELEADGADPGIDWGWRPGSASGRDEAASRAACWVSARR